jgi:hypothetical protein
VDEELPVFFAARALPAVTSAVSTTAAAVQMSRRSIHRPRPFPLKKTMLRIDSKAPDPSQPLWMPCQNAGSRDSGALL